MKKIFAVVMVIIMLASCFALTGCGKSESKNLYKDLKDFDSHVDEDSVILGVWSEKLSEESSADEIEWEFFESTTMHIREFKNDVSFSTICTYNYNEETNDLSYYMFHEKNVYKAKVEIKGNTMSFIDESGNVFKTFQKIK